MIDVRQPVAILEGGKAVVADDGINLGLRFALHLWVQLHREEERDQCANGLCPASVQAEEPRFVS